MNILLIYILSAIFVAMLVATVILSSNLFVEALACILAIAITAFFWFTMGFYLQ